jgi:hypothetical protein
MMLRRLSPPRRIPEGNRVTANAAFKPIDHASPGTFDSIRFTPNSKPSVVLNPTPAFVTQHNCAECVTIPT